MLSPLLLLKVAFRNTYMPNDVKNFSNEYGNLDYLAGFIEIPNWRKKTGKQEELSFVDGSKQTRLLVEKQTWGNLGKKFVGWQDNVSTIKKVRNIFLAIFFFVPINLATVLIRTPINIIRLFTEFLPAVVMIATHHKLKNILEFKIKMPELPPGAALGLGSLNQRDIAKLKRRSPGTIALGVLLGIIHAVALLIVLASRSMTNPVRAFMGAWHTGYMHSLIKNKYLRIFVGAALAITTLAFTIIGFTLLAGIPAIQAGAAALLHYAASVLPQVMAVLSGVGLFAAKVVSALLWFAPAAGQFLAAGVAAMPELLGIAGLAALLMPTLGNVLSPKIVSFQENWYAPSEKKSNNWRSLVESEDARETPSSYREMHRGGVSLTSSRPSEELPAAKPVALSLAPVDVDTEGLDEAALSEDNAVTPRRRSLSASSSE